MGMAIIRIIDIGVNSPLKNLRVMRRFAQRHPRRLAELHVEEGGDVTEVEDACVAQLDGLGEELVVGDHAARDGVPGGPEAAPVGEGGGGGGGVLGGVELEGFGTFGEHVDVCLVVGQSWWVYIYIFGLGANIKIMDV